MDEIQNQTNQAAPASDIPAQAAPAPRRKMPGGLRAIAVINSLGAAFLLYFGVLYLWQTFYGLRVGERSGTIPILIGLCSVLLALFGFYLSFRLYRGTNWARKIFIGIYSIGIVLNIIQFALGQQSASGALVPIIFSAVFAGYLLFSKDVQDYVRRA